MVATLSLDEFTIKIQEFFCETDSMQNKYSEIWLSEVDFGGLYRNDKFVVNFKTMFHIESCNEEIINIVTQLSEKLSPDELSFIWRVEVYNSDDLIHCSSEDIVVYLATNPC